ncbi:MAG TPA: hypothetical protein VF037_05825 [Gemmatimonadales bacterium]
MKALTITLLVLAAACSHGEPFSPPDATLDGPLVPGEPLRLTYSSVGGTSAPAWLPDADSIIYAYGRRGSSFRVPQEGCLGVLASGGGTIGREICSRTIFANQMSDVFTFPAVSDAGQLAFMHVGQATQGDAIREAILAAPFDDPTAYTIVRSFPFQGDAFYLAIDDLQWLGESTLIFIGLAEEQLPPACPTCDPELIRYSRAVLAADAMGSGTVTVIPGTETATSVTAGESADVIYYTLGGDSRIFRRVLSSGDVTVAHDFGAPTVVRGVDYAAGLIVAMIDGRHASRSASLGTVQISESGGMLVMVVPAVGASVPVTTAAPMWFRRPALSANGTEIVAEGEVLQLDPIRNSVGTIVGYDTIPGPTSIWRLAVP